MGSQTWIDSKGIFWLFGGSMFDAVGNLGLGMAGHGNDLWKYDGTYWTWVAGSSLCNNDAIGNYGVLGVPSSTNEIPYRQYMEGWTDASDNLWIFAGYGAGRTTGGGLNNIWKYDGTYWTWMAGNDEGIGENPAAVKGIYGTKGSPDSANVPGARYFSMGCLDKSGNFWAFGGQGVDGIGTRGYLNDLWMYKP